MNSTQIVAQHKLFDIEQVGSTFDTLVTPGDVHEVRVLNASENGRFTKTYSGYFDSPEKVCEALRKFPIGHASGFFISMNPVDPKLISRACNRFKQAQKNSSTSDKDVVYLKWLLIDCDAARPSGISASDGEKQLAFKKCDQVCDWLRQQGFPAPLLSDSGNGAHALYRVDLPPNDSDLVSRVLNALSDRFSDDEVKIDTTVFNPSRISKFYGTRACKGDDTPDRPHRMSKILDVPEQIEIVPKALLEAVASSAKVPQESSSSTGKDDFLDRFIVHHDLKLSVVGSWNGTGRKWAFTHSPMCEHHGDGPYLAQQPSGAIVAGCHHDSCTWGWRELRATLEPTQVHVIRHDDRDEWLESTPVEIRRHHCNDIPGNTLRGWLGGMVKALSEFTETPLVFSFLMALAVVATAVQRKIALLVEPGYFESLCFWVLPTMEPSNRKSAVVGKLIAPVLQYESDISLLYGQKYGDQRDENIVIAKRIEHLQGKASKADDASARKELLSEINELRDEIVEVPPDPQFIADDATPEAIAALLHRHGERMALLSDEGGNVFSQMAGRYSGTANLDPYLKSYSASAFTVNRRGTNEVLRLHHPHLTIGVSPQPEIIKEQAKNAEFVGRGVLSRFVLALPQSKVGFRRNEPKPIIANIANAFEENIIRLFRIPHREAENGRHVPHVIQLSPDAYTLWKAYQAEIEQMMRPYGKLGDPALKYWAGKHAGNTARMAALMHIAEAVPATDPITMEIPSDVMQRAINAQRILIDHAICCHDLAAGSSEYFAANELYEWLRSSSGVLKNATEISVREIYEHVKGRDIFRETDRVKNALKVLNDLGYVREIPTDGRRGRPSQRYELHPSLRTQG